jgi:hypothetical protein
MPSRKVIFYNFFKTLRHQRLCVFALKKLFPLITRKYEKNLIAIDDYNAFFLL